LPEANIFEVPPTPRDELHRRLTALQRHLVARDLDGALVTQNVDLLYFTGSMQSGVLVVPAAGRPVYAVRRVLERARRESTLEQIVPLTSFRDVPALARDAVGGDVRRVGMALDVLPVLVRDRFASALGSVEIADISGPVRLIRAVKSAYELEKMRDAARLSEAMLRVGLEHLHEGITELELAGRVEAAARREGHQGIVRVRGWNQEVYWGCLLSGESGAVTSFPDLPLAGEGLGPAMPYGSGRRRIVAGEPVVFDYTAALDGYVCDQTRTLVIGVLPDRLQRAHDASVEILKTVEAAIRPGVTPQDLYHLAVARARDLGYADAFMGNGPLRARYIGHGVGLELDEWPVLAEGFTNPLEPGHVFCVEPKMVFPGEGAVGIEDEYAVTLDGAERLTRPEQRLFTV
jgi:Xaa-Pro dipeptidase